MQHKLTSAEMIALLDAGRSNTGWGLFKPKTTARLAERGYFEKRQHPYYGEQWHLTESGWDAYRFAEEAQRS